VAIAALLCICGARGADPVTKIFDFYSSDCGNWMDPPLIADPTGKVIYGARIRGGASNMGRIFSLSTDGTAFNVLYDFDTTYCESPGLMFLTGSTLYCAVRLNVSGTSTPDLVAGSAVGWRRL